MYTTKSLSRIKATPSATWQRPEDGSGYLVVQERGCMGYNGRIRNLPFPQNKILTVHYTRGSGRSSSVYTEKVLFVPVMNQPLSANRYYVVVAKGDHKGEIFTCSKKEDMTTNDTDPKPFNHGNIYQQIEIIPHNGRFTAKSIARDGYVPLIFRQKYWISDEASTVYDETSISCQINEALGLNSALRYHLPELDVLVNRTVGKWCCPFFFVKESNNSLQAQMERSMFYEITLEQFWEQILGGVENKRILFEGREVMQQEGVSLSDGFMWFKKRGDLNGQRIGLSLALWDRVKLEEYRQGWMDGDGAIDFWAKFGSFVLVERFLFKRTRDQSLALTLDFLNANKIVNKYEFTPIE